MKTHTTTAGDTFLAAHIDTATWSAGNRRRTPSPPADFAARFLTASAIALGVLILLAVLSIPFL
jgi:hypothetical protein